MKCYLYGENIDITERGIYVSLCFKNFIPRVGESLKIDSDVKEYLIREIEMSDELREGGAYNRFIKNNKSVRENFPEYLTVIDIIHEVSLFGIPTVSLVLKEEKNKREG